MSSVLILVYLKEKNLKLRFYYWFSGFFIYAILINFHYQRSQIGALQFKTHSLGVLSDGQRVSVRREGGAVGWSECPDPADEAVT